MAISITNNATTPGLSTFAEVHSTLVKEGSDGAWFYDSDEPSTMFYMDIQTIGYVIAFSEAESVPQIIPQTEWAGSIFDSVSGIYVILPSIDSVLVTLSTED